MNFNLKPQSGQVRVRFAPSPTGLLHLGGLRTAIYNYLFARHYQGQFIVRFEDTDNKRNLQRIENTILADLRWLDIVIDESIDTSSQPFAPYIQSARQKKGIYAAAGEKLLMKQLAYHCFCTKKQLEISHQAQKKAGKKAPAYAGTCRDLSASQIEIYLTQKMPFCLRLRVPPEQKVNYQDGTYGKMRFDTQHIEDFVLLKADQVPTYNFAVVVDDHLMKITDVIRGSDHISNTPKQILLYQAFKWNVPRFTHLTLIGSETHKFSKRHPEQMNFLSYYRNKGFLPISLFNYLALMGWCPSKYEEIFSQSELIEMFDGNNLNKAFSQFSYDKLAWINQQHCKNLSDEQFLNLSTPFLKEAEKLYLTDRNLLDKMALTLRGQIQTFSDLPFELRVFFPQSPPSYSEKIYLYLRENQAICQAFQKAILNVPEWNLDTIAQVLYAVQGQSQMSKKKTFVFLRLLLTNQTKGPRLRSLIYFLGLSKVTNIVNNFLAIKSNQK